MTNVGRLPGRARTERNCLSPQGEFEHRPQPTPAAALLDRLGRPLRDLRVSVTDRCNLRCGYCMPREVFGPAFRFLPRAEILTFEELARVVRVFREHGVEKVRLTGGEPLLRRDLPLLVEMLAATQGLEIALTTNGVLLAEMAPGLAAAGLTRVSVSLDSLDDAVFRAMADADVPVERVLRGIDAALAAGLAPVKINAVVRRGMNDHTVVDLARRFKGTGATVRFIEYMDVGATNGWRMDEVVPAAEIVAAIDAAMPIVPIGRQRPGEVAERWAYADGSGEVGVIASVTRPFCGDCTRARLSAEGRVYTCLFAAAGTDLRGPLREGASDDEIAAILHRLWTLREDRYSEQRTEAGPSGSAAPRIEMSYIGG